MTKDGRVGTLIILCHHHIGRGQQRHGKGITKTGMGHESHTMGQQVSMDRTKEISKFRARALGPELW